MNVTRPSFFMVGAPKCGTTAMNEYFRQHPELFIPQRQKDLAYFGEDLHRSRPRESLEEYLAYYERVAPGQRAGEVCVWYLYSPAATAELKAFAPDAPIFVMVRNPVDLLYSQHSQLVYSQDEDIEDFDEALAAEPDRRAGRRIPKATGNRVDEGLYYRFLGEYSPHIERYREVFGPDNVHVIVYDDLRADTPGVVRGIFEKLGVDPGAEIDYRVFNANKVPRSSWAQRLLREPPAGLERAFRTLTPKRLHGRLVPALVRANTRYEPRPPMTEETRRRLQEDFRPEVERLSALLDRDLTGWCGDAAVATTPADR
jgi:hypothetical protein